MELNVKIEEISKIARKLTIKVPAKIVAQRFEKGLVEVQKTANLKGFRPGQAPISVVKQFYGEDLRHRLYHSLIDESFQEAVREKNLKAIGRPKIETGKEHKTGEGEHDHALHEDQDLTFTAEVEILPEIEVKNYTGIALERDTVDINAKHVEEVVERLRDAHGELVPVSGGLILADGTSHGRPVQMKDHADINFKGGLVTANGIEAKEGMSGNRLLEVGSNSLIPGFEEQMVGMKSGETKTFRIPFPKDFYDKDMAGKDAEFTVTVNDIKEKKLPELNEEFAKEAGYESIKDLRQKAHDYLLKERTEESDRKIRSALIDHLIQKTPFDVPQALVESQTRALAQDWAQELKRQGVDETTMQSAILSELENMKKRAESQVRASLVLEAIAKKENIEVKQSDIDEEVGVMAANMQMEPEKLKEFYAKNSDRREDLSFRIRQDRTVKFLLDKAKIKSKS